MKMNEALALATSRIRNRRALRFAYLVFTCSAGAAIVWLIAGRLFPVTDIGLYVLLIPLVLFAAAYLYIRSRPGPVTFEAAVALDRLLGLRESVSTASYLDAESRGDELTTFVHDEAERRLAGVSRERIGAAFTMPSGRSTAISAGLLLIALLVSPLLPSLAGAAPGHDPASDRAEAAREAQRIREAARLLEKRAKDVERAAELAQLEKARNLARKLQLEAEKLSTQPQKKRDALATLSRLSEALRREQGGLFDEKLKDNPFGLDELTADRLAELAHELDMLDPEGLELDLDTFKDALGSELAEALKEGREPRLDQQQLQDLIDRMKEAREFLEQINKLLAQKGLGEGDFARLTEKQIELMRRIQEQLDGIQGYCQGCQGGGRPMSAEDLEKLLKKLESLSEEELAQLIEMLREAQSMEALAQSLKECKGGIADEFGSLPSAELKRLMRHLASLGSGGQMGPNAGRASGGQAPRGPDDGRGEEPTPVRGKLDPTGALGQKVPFRGIPRRTDAQKEFDETIQRAASDAEESLGKDLLPPDARPYVRRYFEALEKDLRKK